MAQYLTYEEYIELGGELDEVTFAKYEFDAEAIIDWYTFDRLQSETELSDKVKMCMYRLIDLISIKYNVLTTSNPNQNSTDGTTGAIIASQENDGVATTFVTLSVENLMTMCKNEIEDIIKFNLRNAVNSLGRKLLYRGYYPGE